MIRAMLSDESPTSQEPSPPEPDAGQPAERAPEIEDAYEPAVVPSEETLIDDEAELLDASARSLETAAAPDGEPDEAAVAAVAARSAQVAQQDDTSDAASIPEESGVAMGATAAPEVCNWDTQRSARKFVVELKNIEQEVRRLLEDRDPKRKRKLGGTRRWSELTEDVLSWRYTGRIDESVLTQLLELIARRHYLFNRLSFLAATRPTWNT